MVDEADAGPETPAQDADSQWGEHQITQRQSLGQGVTEACHAAFYGDMQQLAMLGQQNKLDADSVGASPFIWACYGGKRAAIMLLLEDGLETVVVDPGLVIVNALLFRVFVDASQKLVYFDEVLLTLLTCLFWTSFFGDKSRSLTLKGDVWFAILPQKQIHGALPQPLLGVKNI